MARFLFYPDVVKKEKIYLDIAKIKINSLYVDYACFDICIDDKVVGELWLDLDEVRDLRVNIGVNESVLLILYFNEKVLYDVSIMVNEGKVIVEVVKEKCNICSEGMYRYEDSLWFCDICDGIGYRWRINNYEEEKI